MGRQSQPAGLPTNQPTNQPTNRSPTTRSRGPEGDYVRFPSGPIPLDLCLASYVMYCNFPLYRLGFRFSFFRSSSFVFRVSFSVFCCFLVLFSFFFDRFCTFFAQDLYERRRMFGFKKKAQQSLARPAEIWLVGTNPGTDSQARTSSPLTCFVPLQRWIP